MDPETIRENKNEKHMNVASLLTNLFSSRAQKFSGGQAFAEGNGVPTDGTSGYCIGCDYTNTANGAHYINTGTVASSVWTAAGTTVLFSGVTAGTVTASKGVVCSVFVTQMLDAVDAVNKNPYGQSPGDVYRWNIWSERIEL